MLPVRAQDKPTLRFAAVFSDKDIRADMIRMVSKDVEADVKIEPFYGGTLFKQGTELVALQRDNLEMGNVAPQDISKQVAAWSVLTSAYTFRDANHVLSFFASDVGAQMKKQAEDQLKIKILGPTFFGTRPDLLRRVVCHQQLDRVDNASSWSGPQRVAGVTRTSMEDVMKGAWPFLLAELFVPLLLILFPPLVTIPARWLIGSP